MRALRTNTWVAWAKHDIVLIVKRGLPGLLILFATLCMAACGGPRPRLATAPNRIVIMKSEHTMILMHGSQVLETYRVALGRGGAAGKRRNGDHRTPEGQYLIDLKKRDSRFYRAFHISYPNARDIERARNLGVDAGSGIEIHGLPPAFGWIGSFHHLIDWTDGCIALTNAEMDEMWPLVAVGTPVEIRH
jgi:murein L,D-transpeptidase YafK